MRTSLFLLTFLTMCFAFSKAEDLPCAKSFDYQKPVLDVTNKTSVDVEIRHSDRSRVEVFASEEVAEDILIDFFDGRLYVSVHNNLFGKFRNSRVVVETPDLLTVKNHDCGKCHVVGFEQGAVEITSSGSGSFEVDDCDFTTLIVQAKSPADIDIANVGVDALKVYSYGSGDLEISNSRASRCTVRTHGSSCCEMYNLTADKLFVMAKGTGNFFLSGIDAQKVEVQLLHSGHMVINGKANVFKPVVKGSGTIDYTKLKIK